MAGRTGWDGSPTELQPMFENNAYLAAAHLFGDHSETTSPMPSSTDGNPSPETQATAHMVRVKMLPASEKMAMQLLEKKDFTKASCHQLLDSVVVNNDKRASRTETAGTLMLGLYSHGNLHGVTKATKDHRNLAKYLLAYLRHHEIKDSACPVTSLSVGRNVQAACHRDVRNLKGSLNWFGTVGDFTGGSLWVQCQADYVPPNAVWREVQGQRLPGFLVDGNRNYISSFSPDSWHSTEPFKGERYSLTAFTTRSISYAEPHVRRRLRRSGFLSSTPSTASSSWTCDDDLGDLEADFRNQELHEAYPTREWRTPGEGEVAVMETTDEEADGQPLSRVARVARKKELPWRSIPEADVPKFVQAVVDEWSEWTKWSSCRPVHLDMSKVSPELVLKSRVCYRWKIREDGSLKPKARIVVAGFKDPHLPLLTRDAPVLSRAGLQCLLQWAASVGGTLYNADCKSAFLQGEPDNERPQSIFMKPPEDDISRQAIPDWSVPTLLTSSVLQYMARRTRQGVGFSPRATYPSLPWMGSSLLGPLPLALQTERCSAGRVGTSRG